MNTDKFDWYFRLGKAQRARVDAAIKVLIRAGFGTPTDCLDLLFEKRMPTYPLRRAC